MLTQNWELKLLALGLAVALWLFVVTSEKAAMVVPVPLELHSLPADLQLVGPPPEAVEVQLAGLRTSLAQVGERVRARLSLAAVRPGDVVLRLQPEDLELPRGVTAVRINPATVRVTVEPVRAARVKVLPRLSGVLSPGYRVSAVRVIPDEVEVSGPASQVDQLGQVFTEPVDISGESTRLERTVGLVPVGDAVRLAGPRTARVIVEVANEPGSPGAPMPLPPLPERRMQ